MPNPTVQREISKRRTFAIISHPDAGKTTMTEKLLHIGGAIQQAGTVKARKSGRHATSDWMEMEKQRGISVTSSVMQFEYNDRIVNLLDTPGHEDFSEDTYRTLTAVDSALMVIDVAKGVEERTIKLMDVCRLRDTPIMSFVNKMDRVGKDPLELMDEIESVLKIRCAPMTWPIGQGREFVGVYRLYDQKIRIFADKSKIETKQDIIYDGIDDDKLTAQLDATQMASLRDEIELLDAASHPFVLEEYLAGTLSPVFFGSALNDLGIFELMDNFTEHAPPPLAREAEERKVKPDEDTMSGFIFKIQANMDPNHHDRIAFMRITSGQFERGMKLRHVREKRDMTIHNAITFMAARRDQVENAFAGDIIGIHNHGGVQIGDTFTEGEALKFQGIPFFAPELFRRVALKDPLKAKALQKGLIQLSEEGATQVFRPLISNELILGAVGILQFDVVASRLQAEYKVDSAFEAVPVTTARWLTFPDSKMEADFRHKNEANLALDGADFLTYLAPNRVNLRLTQERWPDVKFSDIREL